MKKERIEYLDVAKGILMLLVIMHHIPFVFLSVGDCQNVFFEQFSEVRRYIYMPYFMTCFFLITGMCSNFNKPFSEFLKNNIISLLFPACVISASSGWGLHWFIITMFIARIGYWLLNSITDRFVARKRKRFVIIITSILISIAGASLNTFCPSHERYFLFHVMGFFMYMSLGQLFRDFLLKKSIIAIGCYLYIFVTFLLIITETDMPFFEYGYNVSHHTFVLHTILGLSGSLMVIGLARILTHSKVLQYIGRWSIVILLTHTHIIKLIYRFTSGYINIYSDKLIISASFFLLIFTLTILLCLSIVRLADTKYGCYFAGKF